MTDHDHHSHVEAHRGFFPFVTGNEVNVSQAGVRMSIVRGDFHLTQGGAQRVAAGGNVSIHQGGCQMVASAGDVSITQGGALVAVARTIRTEESYVGIAIGRNVDLHGSTVLVGPKHAALAGGAAAAVLFVLSRLFRRR